MHLELPSQIVLGVRAKRALGLALFLALLFVFRGLAVIGVVFVATSGGLGHVVDMLERKARLKPGLATAIVFGAFALVLAGLVAFGVSRSLSAYGDLASGGLESRIHAIRDSDTVKQIEALDVDVKPLIASLEQFGHQALGALKVSGELLLHALIGFLLALVYRLEKDDVDRRLSGIAATSIVGAALRYAAFLAEAVMAALKLQVAVALVNSLLTGIVILALGLQGAPTLVALVFLFGLMPVVGNVLSGAVLTVLAYLQHGPIGPVVFIVSTFVLHKLESFYLNPRLTQKHVQLPPLAIIVSLLAFEHLFGIVGLFLSFPTIYLVMRIADHWRSSEAAGEPEPAPAS